MLLPRKDYVDKEREKQDVQLMASSQVVADSSQV